ncbi:signal peptidase I [Actinomadura terrae]|uniref:signal peptidase I n=1 Tax=Actinomadura terrae TaxID=604353 RepID=UPI001FA6D71F|nr:signal peptidase I [Actinomadura terrae]
MQASSDGAAPHEEHSDRSSQEHDDTSPTTSSQGAASLTSDIEDSEDASPGTDDSKESKKRKKKGSFWKELPVLVLVAVVLALLIKAFAVQAFYIPSGSMENTLQIGDRVLVNKIVYHTRDVERGDIVVFDGMDSWDPEVAYSKPTNPVGRFFRWVGGAFGVSPGEKDYIKRVVGIPGDRVKCCDAQGRVSVNGVPLDERQYLYTNPATHEQNRPSDQAFDVTVQPGTLWVMGDHRAFSSDSRAHLGDPGGGAIPKDRVIGRAFVVVWPLNRMDTLPVPHTFRQHALQAAMDDLVPAAPSAVALLVTQPALWRLRRRERNRPQRR